MTPPPAREIRITALRTLPGKNYWSRGPVTRLDLTLGAYDDVSSADVPGVGERLADALPGLVEHACSIGERGGFLTRLARGTYAAHVVEHVALELQIEAGDDVGYGRTRGAARRGDYVVAFSHAHAAVGRAAAEWATRVVRAAFDEAPLPVDAARRALAEARRVADSPPPTRRVACAVCASGEWSSVVDAVAPLVTAGALALVAPRDLVERGLPYASSRVAILPNVRADDVPPEFRDPERVEQLYSVMVDGLAREGLLVCPARANALREYATERGRRVVLLSSDGAGTGDHVVAALREIRLSLT
jgi:cyanophycin synthetase